MAGVAAFLEGLLANAFIVHVALGLMTLEWIALTALAPAGRRRASAWEFFLGLAPGACLALALRAVLLGEPAIMVWFWFALSLPLHWIDLARRRARF